MRRSPRSALLALGLLVGCGSRSSEPPDFQVAPDPAVHARTSYAFGQAHARCVDRRSTGAGGVGKFVNAFAWMDLDGDGNDDELAAPGGYAMDGVGSYTQFQAWLAAPGGGWTNAAASVFTGGAAESMHPRKIVVGDLNGDGWPDAIVLDHGYDGPPWPGAAPRILLSDGAGRLAITVRDDLVGFHHGGALGDVDADGDLDLVLLDNPGLVGPHRVLLNDGHGDFTVAPDRLGFTRQAFVGELFDLDGDGWLDLTVGGNQWEYGPPAIFWGSSRGTYGDALATAIPAVPGYGVLLDFDAEDLDGDGDRDLVVLRTGGGPGGPGFYAGWAIQILMNEGGRAFTDESATRLDVTADAAASWIDWLYVLDEDGDGDLDLCADAGGVKRWTNDGAGHFARR